MEVCLLLTFVYKWFNSFVYRTCWVPSHIIFVNISFWILIEEEIFRLQSFEVDLELISRNIRTPYRPNQIKSSMPKTPRTISEFQLEFTVSFQCIKNFEQGNVSRDVPKRNGFFSGVRTKVQTSNRQSNGHHKVKCKTFDY